MDLFSLFGTISVAYANAIEEIDKVTGSADDAAKSLDKVSDTSENASGKASTFGQKLASGIGTAVKWGSAIIGGATAAGSALIGFAQQSASAADTVDKMSQKIGVSREAYQELDFICSQSGTSVGTLQAGMKSLVSAMDGAVSGTASNIEQFERLGVSVTDANGNLRSSEDVMWEVFSALQEMDNQTERARLATELFGRSGTELMPLLNGAAGSIDDMRQQAHELGLVLSDELVDNGVNLTDSLDQTKRALQSIVVQLGGALMPIVEQASDYIQKAIPSIQSFVGRLSPIITGLLDGILPPLMSLGEEIFPVLFDLVEQLLPPVTDIVSSVLPLLTTLLSLLLPPIVQIVGAVLPILVRLIQAVLPILNPILALLKPLLDIILILLEPLLELVEIILTPLIELLVFIVEEALAPLQEALQYLSEKLGDASGAFAFVNDALRNSQTFFESFGVYLYDWIHGIIEKAQQFLNSIKEKVTGFFTTVKNAVRVGLMFVVELFKTYLRLISLPWVTLWENCKDKILGAWEHIKNAVSAALEFIRNLISAVYEFIRNLTETVWSAIESQIQHRLDLIRTIVTTVFEAVRNIIREKLTAASELATAIFDKIRDSIRSKIEAARDFVKNAIEKIKGFFNFSWSLPKLKLPHFSINGSFSLDPPSVPSFGIDWYAKGGIMTQPTAFGISRQTGNLQVGGEAGAEAVAPIDTLLGFVRTAVQEENAALAERLERMIALLELYFPMLIGAIPKDVVLDSGEMVGALAPRMSEELGEISEDEMRWRG